MKQSRKLVLLANLFCGLTASAQINAGTIIRTKEVPGKDSIVFYESDYATSQKSFMDLMEGTWTITSIKKRSEKDIGHLAGVTLTLNKDSSFSGQASCNKIWGKFSVKGTSIKFNNIASTKMTCNKQEEEKWLLQLLGHTVSNYTVSKSSLLLRDVSGKIVLEAERAKNN